MIYALKLENDKYYIGFTNQLERRINKHFNGKGSSFTCAYKPLEVIETMSGGKIEERELTMKYMKKFGWENVRGAGWTAVKLEHKPKFLIND